MEPDINRVLEQAQRGDLHAAGELIELFYERVYAFLRRLCDNDADAADLTQRTFSRVWQSLPSFAGRSSISSWIHGIAYHVCVDWRRANGRLEARSEEWWLCRADTNPGPDESAARLDLSASVYASVESLPQDLRDTIHLHYYQGLTIEETAHALGIATSTVKYRQRQAVDTLQKKFATERTVP